MFDRLLRRKSPPTRAEDPGLPEVSQPFPSADAPAPARPRIPLEDRSEGLSVTELSELEASALCAREGIPFFWRKADTSLPDDRKNQG